MSSELLDLEVDAVTIAAPTHLHHDIALTCIARGVHVLVEKPIASSVDEGREIIAAARRAGVTLMVGHVERFNPAVEAIKEAIRDEDILSIAITRVGPFPPRMSNVGVVIDLAVHDIDLIRWFTDSEIVEVQPQLSSAVAEREDIALLQFRTASGVLAHINTNWLTPFKARNVTVATRGKYVMGDLLTRQVTECFGFQPDGSYSMRHLSVGHAEPLAFGTARIPARGSFRCDAGGDRRRRRRQPRNRHRVSRRSPGHRDARATQGPARGRRLIDAVRFIPDSLMNLATPILRRFRLSTLPRSAAGLVPRSMRRSRAFSTIASSFSGPKCGHSRPNSPPSAARSMW